MYYNFPVEALIWILGLAALAFYDPVNDTHFSLCPLDNLGFSFCPGCGLGRSISHLFRGDFILSFNTHPLGIFAVLILLHRVFRQFSYYIKISKLLNLNHG